MKSLVVLLVGCLLMAFAVAGVSADARINVWSHFGGDALYCNHDQGCYALNLHGQSLWSVPEATVVKAVADACATGAAQTIAAGQGSYGPMTLVVTCPNGVILTGFDEWGKWNSMTFTTDYLPVNPASDPGSHSSNVCSWDLVFHGDTSEDGMHGVVGYDIYAFDKDLHYTYLHWAATREGKPSCPEDDTAT